MCTELDQYQEVWFHSCSGHFVVFLGMTLNSHNGSLHPGICVPVNCQGNLIKCWGVTCSGLASHPGEVDTNHATEIRIINSSRMVCL